MLAQLIDPLVATVQDPKEPETFGSYKKAGAGNGALRLHLCVVVVVQIKWREQGKKKHILLVNSMLIFNSHLFIALATHSSLQVFFVFPILKTFEHVSRS